MIVDAVLVIALITGLVLTGVRFLELRKRVHTLENRLAESERSAAEQLHRFRHNFARRLDRLQ